LRNRRKMNTCPPDTLVCDPFAVSRFISYYNLSPTISYHTILFSLYTLPQKEEEEEEENSIFKSDFSLNH
jgi:hypothetical protein